MNTPSQRNSNRDTMQQILDLLQLQLTKDIGSSSSHTGLLEGLYNIMQSTNHPWLVVAGEEWKPYQKSGSEVEFRSTTARLVVREQKDKLVLDGQLIESDSETHRCAEYDMPSTVYDLLQLMEQHIRLINHQKSEMAQKLGMDQQPVSGPKLKQKSDMNKALFEATRKGNLDVVRFLVENGADIHAGKDGAVRWAAFHGHLDVVRFLIENGADIHAADRYGYPDAAVRRAAYNGHLDVVRFLVEKGADIHAVNNYAVRYAAENGHLDVVRFLVKNGTDIHVVNDVAVCLAAKCGHLDVVRFLVENGADIHAADQDGYPDEVVRLAACNGHLDVVRFLVENRADIHAAGWEGPDAAVRGAAYQGYLDVVLFLVENGTDIDVALKYAKQNGHLEVVRSLLKVEYDQKLQSLLSQPQKG